LHGRVRLSGLGLMQSLSFLRPGPDKETAVETTSVIQTGEIGPNRVPTRRLPSGAS
jgi:hypothetical protein